MFPHRSYLDIKDRVENMKKQYILVLLLLFCIFAYGSNPSKTEYVSFVKEELTKEGHPFIGIMTGPFVNAYTTKHNYGLFTLYETQVDEKDSLKAIGFLNSFYWIHTPD